MAKTQLKQAVETADDWTIPQDWRRYTAAEHATWDRLFERQSRMLPSRVTPEFMAGLDILRLSKPGIPDLTELNKRLIDATGWSVVTVPGLVPDEIFFEHLANRRFVAGRFIRKPEQLDYLQEPDIFHDVFGHVPLLANPTFANYMEAYGRGGQRATRLHAIERLSRLYWYTVEFGLIRARDGLRIYGAGIASSYGESKFALEDPSPHRIDFNLKRLMRTKYEIDDYQRNYFVIDSFEDLLHQTIETDFGPLYAELEQETDIKIGTILPTDTIYSCGTQARAGKPAAIELVLPPPALFGNLRPQPADALLALTNLHRLDEWPEKIDLGIGMYRDASGATPILKSVKAAEARLLASQKTKAYIGPQGDSRFTDLLAQFVFGNERAVSERMTGVQTPGGTGALRLGAELVARASTTATVWIGTPTWPNHAAIFREAGLRVKLYPYYDAATGGMDFDAMLSHLSKAQRGDLVLLHGCCHNPTGSGFSLDQWRVLAEMLNRRGLVPFIDLAYQGFGDGLEEDAQGVRLLADFVPEALIAYSCSKNFALYRERVGALWVVGASPRIVAPISDNLLVLARSLWSMPPGHGAAVVRTILEDPQLTANWRSELDAMQARIQTVRLALAAAHPAMAPIGDQRGMFALLPITPDAVAALRERHGIYMAESGRINVAGLHADTLVPFVKALSPFLRVSPGS